MNTFRIMICLLTFSLLQLGCDAGQRGHDEGESQAHDTTVAEPEKGSNGGRMLVNGDFAVELAIFETGVPPEYRAWISLAGNPVAPANVDLKVELTRLGDVIDRIGFTPQDDFLRGDMVIYEPHSFAVSVTARYQGQAHNWQFDSFEGRTRIGDDVAQAFGLETERAGPKSIVETLELNGRIVVIPGRQRAVSARFPGLIRSVNATLGDTVTRGQVLLTVESNESLNSYDVSAPIGGQVISSAANSGEQTGDRTLFSIVDSAQVWAELMLFPGDLARVEPGQAVIVRSVAGDEFSGQVDQLGTVAQANQAIPVRVVLDNPSGTLLPGMYVNGQVIVDEHAVPLAVKRSGLQAFRDFTVVYAKIGDQYEVRMLDLGRQDSQWVEVLGGLEPGTEYVSENSYLVKADIEKSGASHDH